MLVVNKNLKAKEICGKKYRSPAFCISAIISIPFLIAAIFASVSVPPREGRGVIIGLLIIVWMALPVALLLGFRKISYIMGTDKLYFFNSQVNCLASEKCKKMRCVRTNGSINYSDIKDFRYFGIELEGYPPSVREICAAVGLSSPSTVQRYINSLEEKGYILKGGSKKRAITLPKQENEVEVMSVPIVGTVAAGQPILADENVEEYFPLPMNYAGKKDMFMLKVKGESMINAGILDGDYVIVESADTARNGEIVVALLEDSATVKTFYKERDTIRLQPENDALEPIISKDVKILGKVSGVFRKY